jgi:tetratricopeptide (TPR) repeat protein
MDIRGWCGRFLLPPIVAVIAGAQGPSLEERVRQGQRLEAMGDLQCAERLFQDVLREVEQKRLGLTATSAVLDNLASVNADLGRYPEAEQFFQKSLAAAQKATGRDSVETASVLSHLAGMYLELGLVDEAAPLVRRFQSIASREQTTDSLSAAQNLVNLGRSYIGQREAAKALPVLDAALGIFEKQLGSADVRIARTLAARALAYATVGRREESIADLTRAKAVLSSLPPVQPFELLDVRLASGMAYALSKEPAQSEACLNEALQIAVDEFGDNHPIVATVLRNHAAALRTLGRKSEAKDLEKRADALLAANRRANPVGMTIDAAFLATWQPNAVR